jgi:heme exporter protein D
MNAASLSDVLYLGGYGLYVWGSYAVTLALMLLEPWWVRRHRSRAQRAAAQSTAENQR